AALSGNEPSDAVRVVNAVLTAIDSLRGKRNVLLLATSNVSTAIDVAFVDRADMRAYVGPPALRARYDILTSTLLALSAAGIAGDTGAASFSLPAAAEVHAALLASAREEAARSASTHAPRDADATRDVDMRSHDTAAAHAPLAMPRTADSLLESSATAQHAYTALQRAVASGDAAARDAVTAACLFEAAAGAHGFSGRALRKLPLQAHARFLRDVGVPAPLVAFAIARAVHVERQTRAYLEA
ncbi:AAA family ATPase, partial [archaeon]